MSISMIACIDINNGLGKADGSLLFDLPKDMKHFKKITEGKTVVMGRKTWDSLPKKPLPKRDNYILTNNKDFQVVGAELVHSVEEVLDLAKDKEVVIIGGGEIYKQFLNHADKLFLTHVHTIDIEARVFFPDYKFDDWKLVNSNFKKADDKHKHSFTFSDYVRRTKEEMKNW